MPLIVHWTEGLHLLYVPHITELWTLDSGVAREFLACPLSRESFLHACMPFVHWTEGLHLLYMLCPTYHRTLDSGVAREFLACLHALCGLD